MKLNRTSNVDLLELSYLISALEDQIYYRFSHVSDRVPNGLKKKITDIKLELDAEINKREI